MRCYVDGVLVDVVAERANDISRIHSNHKNDQVALRSVGTHNFDCGSIGCQLEAAFRDKQ